MSSESVLVLNASFEPLAVVPTHRAVVLVLAERADAVELSGNEWRTAGGARLECPSVIRLRYMVRVPYTRRVGRPTLRGLIARDGKLCAFCQTRAATTIDHIVPRSRGGEHTWENTCGACERCNTTKADRTPAEANMVLHVTPRTPSGRMWLLFAVAERDPSWEPYLAPHTAPVAV